MMYRIVISDGVTENDYLEHHGIMGMKWGVTNGPPYPLASSDAVQRRRAAAYAKNHSKARIVAERAKYVAEKTGESIASGVKSIKTTIHKNKVKKQRQARVAKMNEAKKRKAEERKQAEQKAEETKAAEEKRQLSLEERKKDAIARGDMKEIYANIKDYTDEEIGEAIYRYSKITEISKMIPKENTPKENTSKKKDRLADFQNLSDKASKIAGNVANFSENAIKLYNSVARVHNAFSDEDDWNLIPQPNNDKKDKDKNKD